MKTFKVSRIIAPIAMAGLLLSGLSCQNEKPELVPAISQSTQLQLSEINALALKATQPGMQQQFDAIEKQYKALDFDGLELFNKEIARLALEKESDAIAGNSRTTANLAELETASQNSQIYRTAINKMSLQLHGVPYNQLDFKKLDAILEKVIAPAQPSDASLRVNACAIASFPYSTTKMDNAPANHVYTRRVGSSSTPNDCDYEFAYSGIRSRISADNYVSQLLCSYWNYHIGRRVYNGSRPGDQTTYLVFGNRGIALYTGTALFDVNMGN